MPKSGFMPYIRLLVPDEWPTLRDVRLEALCESPGVFLSSYASEQAFDEGRWRSEFDRGKWLVGFSDDGPVSLLGVTRVPGMPAGQCYLEYIWVSPKLRSSGFALNMINFILGDLRHAGVRTVFLWVLDGNDRAVRLYRRAGFLSSNHRQPLEAIPGRSEERMHLELAPAGEPRDGRS